MPRSLNVPMKSINPAAANMALTRMIGSQQSKILHPLAIERYVTDGALRLTAQLSGFAAKDLEVSIGHRRAVICGIHSDSNQAADISCKDRKVMRIVELPFDVDPVLARATLQSGKLQVVLPRSR